MGVKLTDAELKTVRCALKAYQETKKKEAKKKANKEQSDNYERLLVIIDDTIELFDGEIHSVYVNKKV